MSQTRARIADALERIADRLDTIDASVTAHRTALQDLTIRVKLVGADHDGELQDHARRLRLLETMRSNGPLTDAE